MSQDLPVGSSWNVGDEGYVFIDELIYNPANKISPPKNCEKFVAALKEECGQRYPIYANPDKTINNVCNSFSIYFAAQVLGLEYVYIRVVDPDFTLAK